MKRDRVVELVIERLESGNLTVSPSTGNVLKNTKYLNDKLLSSTDPNIIKNNLIQFTNEIISQYEERTHSAKSPTKVRDIDVRPILRRKWCSLPPFCKST